jgi:hypothetical protein
VRCDVEGDTGAMQLADGEPEAAPWRVVPFRAFVDRLATVAGEVIDRPTMIAVDGRSSSGKTTLARRLAAAHPKPVVVHTDDIAWRHAVLDWADLLRFGVLEPARRGEPVRYRPPKWDEHGRDGAIEVPPGTTVVVVEGVGAARCELAPLFDATVFVQSDADEIDRRNRARVAAGETDLENFALWMAEEMPFVLAERTWERATAVVAGSPTLVHDPDTEVVISAAKDRVG